MLWLGGERIANNTPPFPKNNNLKYIFKGRERRKKEEEEEEEEEVEEKIGLWL